MVATGNFSIKILTTLMKMNLKKIIICLTIETKSNIMVVVSAMLNREPENGRIIYVHKHTHHTHACVLCVF
jgi:hypothetical protein